MKLPPTLIYAPALCLAFLIGLSSLTAQTVKRQDDGQLSSPMLAGGNTHGLGTGCTNTFLTTHYLAGNGSGGNMFNITPNINMFIECLDIHISTTGFPVDVNLWYKVGTCDGFESDSTAWTLLGVASGVGAGPGLPTNVSFAGNGVVFEAGVVYGIFVDVPTNSVSYTNGGPTIFSNADLSLETYFGKSTWASTFYFREWNGTLYYTPAAPSANIVSLQAGQYGTFEMTNVTVGTLAHFALSIAGLGTTPSIFGDLGLASPVFIIPPLPLVADPGGLVSLTITLPPASLGRTIFAQGIEIDGLTARITDPVSAVVQ